MKLLLVPLDSVDQLIGVKTVGFLSSNFLVVKNLRNEKHASFPFLSTKDSFILQAYLTIAKTHRKKGSNLLFWETSLPEEGQKRFD